MVAKLPAWAVDGAPTGLGAVKDMGGTPAKPAAGVGDEEWNAFGAVADMGGMPAKPAAGAGDAL